MGVDYYNILKVPRTATEEDLRRSYKRLAMRWHPDKNMVTNKEEAEAKFKQISEAYDVLFDPQKRRIFDLYGEEGFKSFDFNTTNDDDKSKSGGVNKSVNGATGKTGSFRFTTRDAEDIFAEFFGGSGGGGGGGRRESGRGGGVGRTESGVNQQHWSGEKGGHHQSGRKAAAAATATAATESKLVCSLEDLYKGARRKMRISRTVPDDFWKPKTVEEILKVDIKPGWKKGTKITFPEKGNQEFGSAPADLIFVIDEKPHPVFKREGNDLVVNQKITLLEALTGKTIELTTLDGRYLTIPVMDVVKPGHEVVISNEGMPISKEPTKKGDLKIKFEVAFPDKLTGEQKSDLKRVLGGVNK